MTTDIEQIPPEQLDRIIAECGRPPDAAIPILQALQREFRYLPQDALRYVAAHTEITPAQLTGVATFYSQFRHHGAGKHLIQVCHGTACHVAGAELVTEALRRHFQLDGEEDTSVDGLFTVERVACLGCCSLAPVMLIDDVTYGRLDPAKAVESVEAFLRDEKAGVHARRREEKRRVVERAARKGRRPTELRVGLNSCCIASGSMDVCQSLEKAIQASGGEAIVKPVGCTGMCHRVPIVEVVEPDGSSSLYGDNDAAVAARIVRETVPPRGLLGRARSALTRPFDLLLDDEAWETTQGHEIDPERGEASAFLSPQVRIVTEQAGVLDPSDIDDYIAADGYQALQRVVHEMEQEELIGLFDQAEMRGRGGAGFSTAEKWRSTRDAAGERKFVVCNGDEGDPGAFMDRMLLEAYPHRIIEGLAIAARAVGAEEAYFYVRAEYRLAVERIERAIEQAEAAGFLGQGICGSDVHLSVKVMQGAGAFVCGEETALIASIEGRRGMPRFRPPYPSEQGLWDCPTSVNNVETYATLPWIVRHGADAFRALGTERSKGTKVFALAGRVERGGLIEVPMGTTVDEIVNEVGGGVRGGGNFKAVQLGGPSGGCIPARLGDTPIDYEAVHDTGAIMGSGGLVVLDDATCMVDIARFFLDFTQSESCGRCTFCRIGTKRMLEILERLCAGAGTHKDLDDLEQLAHQVRTTSLCGLGRTAPNPILTTLRYFREEYEAHIDGRCPAGKCPELISFVVGGQCIGCTLCAQQCPVDAITPRPYEQQSIDDDACVRCGACKKVCPESAITIEPRGRNTEVQHG